ncbi:MAG: hypothetical protein AAFP89_00115 [Bacteroidota bacterium]
MKLLMILFALGCMSVVGRELLIPPPQQTILFEMSNNCEELQPDTLDTLSHIQAYRALKQRMKTYRSQGFPKITQQQFMYHALVDSIFPYWYGTSWDFNGITETPRKGKIACGYFVSTTLRDLGIPLNRYRLAQKASSHIIKDLCDPSQIQTFRSRNTLYKYLHDLPQNGLFVVGLSQHVGFILKNEEGIFFIHANYAGEQLTVREAFRESAALQHSQVFVLGNLLESKKFLDSWK